MDTTRIEVSPDAADVARARQFVTSLLEVAGLGELAPEAGLCIGELVTNAVLHGRGPITAGARVEPAGVRLEVTDGSARSAMAGRALPGERPESMTGRGLMIVSMLADRCGEELRDDGKTVWCELAWPRPDRPGDSAPAPWPARVAAGGERDGAVALEGLPASLAVALERRLGDLVRELRLSSDRPSLAGRLAGQVAAVAERHRHTDNVLSRALRAEPGRDRVRLELAPGDLGALDDLGELVDATAELCRRGALLTLPLTAAERRLLKWCTDELRRRLGGEPPASCPVDDRPDEGPGSGSPLGAGARPARRRGLVTAVRPRGSDELRVVVAETNVLRSLADAARAMAGARDVEDLLRVTTEAAQSLVGTHQAVTHRLFGGWDDAMAFVSLSDRYRHAAEASVLRASELGSLVAASQRPLRLSAAQVRQHPAVAGLAEDGPAWTDYLAAPIVSRTGHNIGVIQLAEKVDGSRFDDDDEAVVVQLAYMASAAIEHVELLEGYAATMTRLDLALDASELGVWTWDMAGGTVTWSPTMERLYGFAPGAFPGTFDAYRALIHPEDRAATLERIRLAASRLTRFEYAHRVIRLDGRVRWLQGVGVPVAGPDGAALTMTGVCGDVTDQREVQEGLRREHRLVETLQQVGKAVTANLDVDEVAQVVADASVALTPAEWGAFVYEVGDGSPPAERRVAVASRAGRLPPGAADVLDRAPLADLGVDAATTVVADLEDAGAAAAAPALGSGAAGVRSYLAVPIRLGGGERCGGLVFGHRHPGVFSADDARLVEGIASYAAIAVSNGRLYEQARREVDRGRRMLAERDHIARTLQQSLLPPRLPELAGVELASVYEPSGLGNEVGGDFYDVFEMTRREWAVVVGDVCGKGPEAAAVTAAARHTVRAVARVERQPSAVLRRLNDALVEYGATDRFCTVCFVRVVPIVHGLRLSVSCGGHAPPLVVRADGRVESVGAPGSLLGVFDTVRVWEETVQLGRGDAVVCFTDGITEARRGGELFGDDRVRATLAGLAGGNARALADGLVAAARAFTGGPPRDDIAVVALRIPPG